MDIATFSILQRIYATGGLSRRALNEQTGLGANRISAIAAQQLAGGSLREEVAQGSGPGRPAGSLSINPDAGRIVGLDIGGEESRAVLTDLAGQVLASRVSPTRAVPDRDAVARDIASLVRAVCGAKDMEPAELTALGVGLRAIVDTRLGRVLGWPSTPAWATIWPGLDLRAALAPHLEAEVTVVEDSVRAMGAAAHRFGAAQNCTNFLYLLVDEGIGAAVFVNGVPYRGGAGLAGELGHVTVDDDGPWCSCGNRGCLEVLASTTAVLARVHERMAESRLISALREPFEQGTLTLETLLQAARAGDKIAFQILDETGRFVGRVLAIALNLFGPEAVIIGGPLVHADGVMLEAIRRQVRLRALQDIASQVQLVADDQGDLAGARGAAILALDAVFASPSQLERLLALNLSRGR